MYASRRERATFAPDVLATALAVPGGPCARALERIVAGGVELVMSSIVLRATLVRLVTLFDLDAEAVARTALLLHDLSTDFGLSKRAGMPGIDAMVGHLATVCAVSASDALVVPAGPFGLDAFATGAFATGRAAGGASLGRRGPSPLLHGRTRVVLARDFARGALVRELATPALSDRMLRLEAIACSLEAPGRRRVPLI